MGFRITHTGDFSKTEKFLLKVANMDKLIALEKYGKRGVDALSSATPMDSGNTAGSWNYEIHSSGGNVTLHFTNSAQNKGVNIAILLQYGHGTGTGGYVQGRDFINPAIQPIFDQIAEEMWKEVQNA